MDTGAVVCNSVAWEIIKAVIYILSGVAFSITARNIYRLLGHDD